MESSSRAGGEEDWPRVESETRTRAGTRTGTGVVTGAVTASRDLGVKDESAVSVCAGVRTSPGARTQEGVGVAGEGAVGMSASGGTWLAVGEREAVA